MVLFGNIPAAPGSSITGANSAPTAAAAAAAGAGGSGNVTGIGVNDIQTIFGSTGSKWTQISRTEVTLISNICDVLHDDVQ